MTYTNGKTKFTGTSGKRGDTVQVRVQEELKNTIKEEVMDHQAHKRYEADMRHNTIVKVIQTIAGLGMVWAMAWCSASIWG